MQGKLTAKDIFLLLGINLLYAGISLFSSIVSKINIISLLLLGLLFVFFMFAVYAVCWQRILKHIQLSTAYMFKGSSLLFVLLLSSLFLGDPITWQNLVGSCFIIVGIVLFANADK